MNSDSDIGFHWDKDYAYEEKTGMNLYPHLGTVTYLTDCGGPTLILNLPGRRGSTHNHAGSISQVGISHPSPGKHMKFDGMYVVLYNVLAKKQLNRTTNYCTV